jgi:hypothetical protein
MVGIPGQFALFLLFMFFACPIVWSQEKRQWYPNCLSSFIDVRRHLASAEGYSGLPCTFIPAEGTDDGFGSRLNTVSGC